MHDIVKNTLLRMILAACTTVAFGLLFFQLSVFNMRMMASQFMMSGVTAGIAYAALKTPRWRDGLAALFVWYIVLTFFISQYNWWLLVLFFAYIMGIAAAVYLYLYFVRREIVRGALQRVAASGVITAVANAVIILFLGLVTMVLGYSASNISLATPGYYASMVFRNLQLGTLIGIGFGVGAELAEYIIRRLEGGGAPESSGTPGSL